MFTEKRVSNPTGLCNSESVPEKLPRPLENAQIVAGTDTARRLAVVVRRFPLQPPTPPGEDYFAEPARMMAGDGWQIEFLSGRPALTSLIRRRYDVVHGHSHFRPALLAGILARRAVFTSHSYDFPQENWKRQVLVWLMNRFDRVVALSPHEREVYLAAGVSEPKIVVLPLAVNVSFFTAGNGARFRSRWNIRGDVPLILFVANLRPIKNPDIVARAFRYVRRSLPDARLAIVGQNFMATTAVHGDGVVFTDWLPAEALRDALATADVAVNSSRHESFSLSTFEAMAASRPVCLPDLPSFRSLIGDTVLYHTPTDAEGLAGNILRYLREPELRRAHVEGNRKLVARFDLPNVLEQYRSLYRSLLED